MSGSARAPRLPAEGAGLPGFAAFRAAAAAAAFALAFAGGAAVAAAADPVPAPEPGVVVGPGEGSIPVLVRDAEGRVAPQAGTRLVVEIDGKPVRDIETSIFGASTLADSMAVSVVIDAAALGGLDEVAWAGAVVEWYLDESVRSEARSIWVLDGKRAREVASGSERISSGELAQALATRRSTALWDGLLTVLDRVSEPGGPTRRVVLLLSGGDDSDESVHPVATCATAADTARVAIHVLVPGGRREGAGSARLRSLAARTGGGFLDGPAAQTPPAFGQIVEEIRSAVAMRVRGLPGDPPWTVTIRLGVGAPTGVPATLRPRQALGLAPTGKLALVPLLLALAVSLGLGAVLALRFRAVGRLEIVRGAAAASVSVNRRGVRLGAARSGNDLVLDHPRISRKHAVVKVENGRAVLVDLRSSNGTRINGQPVRSAVVLAAGDRILLADEVELVYLKQRKGRRRPA